MARLHEYQGKAVLASKGIAVPRGRVARSPDEAAQAGAAIGFPVVIKIQAWTTGRAAIGGVKFAMNEREARDAARAMLAIRVGNFPVTELLVEERLNIAHEMFVSVMIDDAARAPAMLLSLDGGSGIEERASRVAKLACDVRAGPDVGKVLSLLKASPIPAAHHSAISQAITKTFTAARESDARSLEVNPLVVTREGAVMAADCRITIDDYAVFRHPELGIEIARELDHPPTELERIAYACEQRDHRGTFYFAQLATAAPESSTGLVGFHGAGGGGSMMSMDAITREGFTIANFTDTSGNPSPAKVYRAARIILQQAGLVGYFGSGSGVASQEQFWSAYGLAKAFWELELSIPAVIRLGGNSEARAVDILTSACKGLPAPVEGYTKSDPPAKIAARFRELVRAHPAVWQPRDARMPGFLGGGGAHRFTVKDGTVWIDGAAWRDHTPAIIARSSGLLKDDNGKPALTCSPEEFLGKDSEMIACEVECRRDGVGGVYVELPIEGLGE